MSIRSSLPDILDAFNVGSSIKPRTFVVHQAFNKPTSENVYYKDLRRLIRPSL